MPSNHQLEAATYMKPTFTIAMKNPNELDSSSKISIHRSDLSSTKIRLSQPHATISLILQPFAVRLLLVLLQK
ncbi:hypothetical protein [Priestia megaterium]|uniref:hypothetical protein n=1 Tax=Priestia megaterium TaxID=1404 RepID=UPI002861A8DA|nr:hypothetical protein [Priestia megaterium]MDR7243267.1 hypothetical protein [Priestia megaterium]